MGESPVTADHPFAPFFRAQGFVLLDGGLATALEDRGHDLRDPLWSARVLLDAPEEVRTVHLDYLRAGADCIETVTYQATVESLRSRGLTDTEAEAQLHLAVRLAVEARDAFWADPANREGRVRPLVAASVGPYGAYLADGSEYTGRYDLDEDALAAWHRTRWRILADSSADLLACETIPSGAEARALVRLLLETPGRWAWISFQCRDERSLADGTPLEEAVADCEHAERVVGIGVNCVPPERVGPLLDVVRSVSTKPVVAYPNSGDRYDPLTGTWRPGAAAFAPGAVNEWRARGARVVGGCCRVGPADISRMRSALLQER